MVNVWYETLGDTMLKEISQPMKDDKKKSEKRERYVNFFYFLEYIIYLDSYLAI